MTKEDLVNCIWEKMNVSKKESAEIVEQILLNIKDVLQSGDKLKIGGFGVFEVRERKARLGRNPKTGEAAEIKSGHTIKFKPGKTLRQQVADGQ
ncbi:integration host factor subunit alpha [bacterium]|nr:integration host factor subunit alpha [candidate division CSSED10-310 bacterium]